MGNLDKKDSQDSGNGNGIDNRNLIWVLTQFSIGSGTNKKTAPAGRFFYLLNLFLP
ncbi:MAG: hypothetical protein LCH54_10210 [Bacteroidetes bacterium]|nr:hypothetical protein [Bacteroidota bacterium]